MVNLQRSTAMSVKFDRDEIAKRFDEYIARQTRPHLSVKSIANRDDIIDDVTTYLSGGSEFKRRKGYALEWVRKLRLSPAKEAWLPYGCDTEAEVKRIHEGMRLYAELFMQLVRGKRVKYYGGF